jgi:hypothetical protein
LANQTITVKTISITKGHFLMPVILAPLEIDQEVCGLRLTPGKVNEWGYL